MYMCISEREADLLAEQVSRLERQWAEPGPASPPRGQEREDETCH